MRIASGGVRGGCFPEGAAVAPGQTGKDFPDGPDVGSYISRAAFQDLRSDMVLGPGRHFQDGGII